MSLPLRDFRLGITESIDIWLDAEAAAFCKDKAAIAREVLQEWAKRKAHAFKVAERRLVANGLQPELDGLVMEDDGRARRGGR
ncbi:MAG: hypothetical protein IT480_06580 [Gammaproteobacteria bacterium]|nr:hypothetical protein [Gammaproteobacteria bacterium]